MEVALAVLVIAALVRGKSRSSSSSAATETEEPVAPPVITPSSSSPLVIRPLSFALSHKLRSDAADALEAAVAESSAPRITSSYRSTEQQAALYELYKAGRGNLAAPPGRSLHERGLALDARGSAAWEAAMVRHRWHRPIVDIEPWHWEFKP